MKRVKQINNILVYWSPDDQYFYCYKDGTFLAKYPKKNGFWKAKDFCMKNWDYLSWAQRRKLAVKFPRIWKRNWSVLHRKQFSQVPSLYAEMIIQEQREKFDSKGWKQEYLKFLNEPYEHN